MFPLNEEETAKRVEKLDKEWSLEKQILAQKQKIKRERARLVCKEKQLTTTKKLVNYLFCCATGIQLFTGYLMVVQLKLLKQGVIMSLDTSPLISLIGAVVGEVMIFAVYAVKSFKENKSMADLDFEKMKAFGSQESPSSVGSDIESDGNAG